MLDLVPPGREDEVRTFVQTRAGVYAPVGPTQVLGFMLEGEIKAGWMFERYTGPGGSVHMHWALEGSKRWLTRDTMAIVAMYVFDQIGVDTVFGEVRASDTQVRSIDTRLGFREVAILEGYFPDDDLVLYSLQKADCMWLPKEFKETANGRQVETTSRS